MYNIHFNDDGISRVLAGRASYEMYNKKVKSEPQKGAVYKQNLRYELALLGFHSVSYFFDVANQSVNLLEIDRCYRLRSLVHPTFDGLEKEGPDDFCVRGSGCRKRKIPICGVDVDVLTCFNNDLNIQNLPEASSEMGKEFLDAADKLGMDKAGLFIPHPLLFAGNSTVCPDTWMPPYCVGTVIEIHEPRFDVLWGMKRFQIAGENSWEIRKRFFDANSNS